MKGIYRPPHMLSFYRPKPQVVEVIGYDFVDGVKWFLVVVDVPKHSILGILSGRSGKIKRRVLATDVEISAEAP